MTTVELDDTTSDTPPPPLTELAEHLRNGPLQRLIELEARTQELGDRMHGSPTEHIEDLAELLRLSLAAMAQFQAFTREFQALVQALATATKPRH